MKYAGAGLIWIKIRETSWGRARETYSVLVDVPGTAVIKFAFLYFSNGRGELNQATKGVAAAAGESGWEGEKNPRNSHPLREIATEESEVNASSTSAARSVNF